jgi:GGDEF domain-containing protein
LVIDADHFKKINDTWGHPTGDMVLRNIAKQCMHQFRVTDTVGRYGQGDQEAESVIGRLGGEEFVILLPETVLEQALIVAERIRSSIERMNFQPLSDWQAKPSLIQVTVSIGVTSLRVHPTLRRAPRSWWWLRHFAWLRVGSVKVALSRPAHQYPDGA